MARRREHLCATEVQPGEQPPIDKLLQLGKAKAQEVTDKERRTRTTAQLPREEGVRVVKGHRYAQHATKPDYVQCVSCNSAKQKAQLNMAVECRFKPEWREDNAVVYISRVRGHCITRDPGEAYSSTCARCHRHFVGMPRSDCIG